MSAAVLPYLSIADLGASVSLLSIYLY